MPKSGANRDRNDDHIEVAELRNMPDTILNDGKKPGICRSNGNHQKCFFDHDIAALLERLNNSNAEEIEEQGRLNALQMFHLAALRVPAYSRFLTSIGIDPENASSIDNLDDVPCVDKKNYLVLFCIFHAVFWGWK